MAQELFDFSLQLLDALAAAADNHAGLAGEDVDRHASVAALDINAADAGGVELFLKHFAQLVILDEVVREILFLGVPARAPIKDHAYARAMRINFLTHSETSLSYFFSSRITLMWLVRRSIGEAEPRLRAT